MPGRHALGRGHGRPQRHHRAQGPHVDGRARWHSVGRDAEPDQVVSRVGTAERSATGGEMAHLGAYAGPLGHGERLLECCDLLVGLRGVRDIRAGEMGPDADHLDVW